MLMLACMVNSITLLMQCIPASASFTSTCHIDVMLCTVCQPTDSKARLREADTKVQGENWRFGSCAAAVVPSMTTRRDSMTTNAAALTAGMLRQECRLPVGHRAANLQTWCVSRKAHDKSKMSACARRTQQHWMSGYGDIACTQL